jgi:hypothetical protein
LTGCLKRLNVSAAYLLADFRLYLLHLAQLIPLL